MFLFSRNLYPNFFFNIFLFTYLFIYFLFVYFETRNPHRPYRCENSSYVGSVPTVVHILREVPRARAEGHRAAAQPGGRGRAAARVCGARARPRPPRHAWQRHLPARPGPAHQLRFAFYLHYLLNLSAVAYLMMVEIYRCYQAMLSTKNFPISSVFFLSYTSFFMLFTFNSEYDMNLLS